MNRCVQTFDWYGIYIFVVVVFFSPILGYPILSHCCNSPTGLGEAKVESCVVRNMTRQIALNTRPLGLPQGVTRAQ